MVKAVLTSASGRSPDAGCADRLIDLIEQSPLDRRHSAEVTVSAWIAEIEELAAIESVVLALGRS